MYSKVNDDENEGVQKTWNERIFRRYYIVTALLSANFFGLFNFVQYLSIQKFGTGENDMRLIYPSFIGFLSLQIFYRTFIHKHEYQSQKQDNQKYSIYFNQDGTLNKKIVTLMTLKQIVAAALFTGMFYMFKFAEAVGLNGGIIASILCCAPLTTAITFYFACDEKLYLYHYVGICFMIIAVICISFGTAQNSSSSPSEQYSKLAVLAPIGFALLSSFLITCMNLLARITTNNGVTQFQFNSDGLMLLGLICLIGFIYNLIVDPYSAAEFLPMAIASILVASGVLLINFSFAYGKAGVAAALQQLQSVLQFVLEVVFLNNVPNFLQIAGLCIGIITGTYLTLKEGVGSKAE